jgi:hypothetical protein
MGESRACFYYDSGRFGRQEFRSSGVQEFQEFQECWSWGHESQKEWICATFKKPNTTTPHFSPPNLLGTAATSDRLTEIEI